jgi:F-type H+-transporting ATPase subunit gamma
MPGTKDIKRRIRSVRSTKQITKAMELVAAAKMRKTQAATLATRTYANLAWDTLRNLTKQADSRIHKLLKTPEKVSRVAVVLLSSNRGLIGAFNENISSFAIRYAKRFENTEFITVGKQGRDRVRKAGLTIAADFDKKDAGISISDIKALADLVLNDFISGKYDKVSIVYTDFVSTLKQNPHVRELLPLSTSRDETLGEVGMREPSEVLPTAGAEYLFEPGVSEVMETLLPRLLTMQIYQAVLETNASEHSARMLAMKNASDAAGDLIEELTQIYNRERQAGITREISEIVSGRLALAR